ncbi:hypothetical protein [Marinobacter shengliensis]|uniref:hypothetical protein n=1 Tax=Marinobacter shengliensis TaxID=1389223 RepID=UPI001109E524|nr:hypothetical protein [Marinobacter shengliensis]
MIKLRPWGELDWLMQQFGHQQWTAILSSSFEIRCTASSIYTLKKFNFADYHLINITPHNHEYTEECTRLIKKNVKIIKDGVPITSELQLDADQDLVKLNNFIQELEKNSASILIDISTMPKRVFMFLTKRLLSFKEIKDIVVCYAKADSYKEGRLTEDAQPVSALPGFSRIDDTTSSSSVIVGVGYMSYDIGSLLEDSRNGSLKILFPFPPGSPSYRRNWGLLKQLLPTIPPKTEIRRIHAMDLFAVYDWILDVSGDSENSIDMLPLGPKPHSLAMGLAHSRLGEKSEVLYSQPKIYRPDYSSGIKKNKLGAPDITAYCLTRISHEGVKESG